MVAYIHENTWNNHKSASGKAIYLTVRFGTSSIHDSYTWLSVSQLKLDKFNEVGWARMEIPDWLIRKNGLQNAAFIELGHDD